MIAKTAKAEKVVALHAKFVDAKAAILADYSGLNVQQLAELRSQLRNAAVELHVVKNTLARRAVEETGFVPLADHFVGPISVAFAQHDAVAMAKALTEYARKEPKLNVRVGFVEGQVGRRHVAKNDAIVVQQRIGFAFDLRQLALRMA